MSEAAPPLLRVGTLERTAVARDLVAHHRSGHLDRAELDARLALTSAARTEDDLHLVTLDLPDMPRLPDVRSGRTTPVAAVPPRNESLASTFDVMVLLVTLAAFVCTGLLFAISLSWLRSGDLSVFCLIAFGSFTIGAGGVHLAHRILRGRG